MQLRSIFSSAAFVGWTCVAIQPSLPAAVVRSVDTLRDVIVAATPGEVISFDSSLSGQTIDIMGAPIALEKDVMIDGSALSEPITIFGHRSEANDSFVFSIPSGRTVGLIGILFRTDDASIFGNSGAFNITDCLFTNASIFSGWGGIQNETNATVTVTESTFVKCSFGVKNLGGSVAVKHSNFSDGTIAAGVSTFGGNLEVRDSASDANNLALFLSAGSLLCTNCNISASHSPTQTVGIGVRIDGGEASLVGSSIIGNAGVGITNSGTLHIRDCNISSNIGGIQNAGTLIVNDSQFVGNSARAGAALLNYGQFAATNTLFQSNAASFAGGAIDNELGVISLQDCVFLTNTGLEGGAIINNGLLVASGCRFTQNWAYSINGYWDRGGALFSSNGVVTLNDCKMTENTALIAGAIYKWDGQMTIKQCSVSNNTAKSPGGVYVSEAGGIYNVGGDLSINDSTIAANEVGFYTVIFHLPPYPPVPVPFSLQGDGGALLANSGRIEVNRSTIAFNHGCGIYQRASDGPSARLDVRNSTIARNVVVGVDGPVPILLGGLGGGLYSAGVAQIEHCTIVGNRAVNNGAAPTRGGGIYTVQSITLLNSILANNTAGQGADLAGPQTGDGNLISTDPLLAPMGDYGGPTQTMPPLLNSPARDSGLATLLSVDQRGHPRPIGTKPDIGAVELDLSASDSQLRRLEARRMASGSVEIYIAADRPLRVLASSDPSVSLETWESLGLTVETPPNSGFFRFEDRQAFAKPRRFYLLSEQ